jgi:rubrerythrin
MKDRIRDHHDAIDLLNDLIQLDYDAIQTYEQALKRVDDDDHDVRRDLDSFRLDHERHVAELSSLITSMGDIAKDVGRDVKGVLLEGMTALRSVTGTVGALKAMRMNEKLTNRNYEKASHAGLPLEAVELVTKNLADERRHLTTIEMHIDRLVAEREEEAAEPAGTVFDEHPNVRL